MFGANLFLFLQVQLDELKKKADSESEALRSKAQNAEETAWKNLADKEKELDEKMKNVVVESELKVKGLQEQLRGAHDNVADAYRSVILHGRCEDTSKTSSMCYK